MTLYQFASSLIGTKEETGTGSSNQIIVKWLKDNNRDVIDDEVPWCSAFVNFVSKTCGFERSRSNSARSWLRIGKTVDLENAIQGDVVIIRANVNDPGPKIIDCKGHVGFFHSSNDSNITILGGNQRKNSIDQVCLKEFKKEKLLGIRRLNENP